MIGKKKVLAIIPARYGSKGVPLKNLREVAGKPLIAYTIQEANKSEYIDKLIISSDRKEIIDVAKKYGAEAPFIRPAELAKDQSPVSDAIIHAIDNLKGYDYLVLLQPTSPLRLFNDIDRCIERIVSKNADSCISVTETEKSPYWMFKINEDYNIKPIIESNFMESRRQDLPKVYIPNGAVYVAKTEWFRKTKSFVSNNTVAYIMPIVRSVDIDTEEDLINFENIIKRNI